MHGLLNMAIDPILKDLFTQQDLIEIKQQDAPTQRAFFNQRAKMLAQYIGNAPDLTTQDYPIDQHAWVRHYQPEQPTQGAILFIHGGGWSIGCVDKYDFFTRHLCQQTQHHVFSLEYRLAPEHPFPCAVEDSMAAWEWLTKHAETLGLDLAQCHVMGDSAGGNLATVICHLAHQQNMPLPASQLLVYPACDFSQHYPSFDQYQTAEYALDRDWLHWFYNNYKRTDADLQDPRMSPLRFSDHHDLPPTLIAYAVEDPLVDGIMAYAKALQSDGVPVETIAYPTMVHGFMELVGLIDQPMDLLQRCYHFLNQQEATTS